MVDVSSLVWRIVSSWARDAKGEDVRVQSDVVLESDQAVQTIEAVDVAVAPDRTGMWAIVAIAAVAALGLVPWLGNSLFADEGATVYSAHLSWSNLWAQSEHVDLVLLPYYVLIHFWVQISGTVEWIRSLSLIAYFATVVVVGWTGLRIAGRWCGVIAAVLTATSTLFVEKSLNARPYEVSALLVALCAVVLFKWLQDGRVRWMWLFSCLALLATAMQLFAVLAPLAMLFGILVVRPRLFPQRLRALFGPLALLVVPAVIWAVAGTRQVGQVNWIASQSLQARLLTEVRGPAIGLLYDLVIVAVVVLALVKVGVAVSNHREQAIFERVKKDRDILALTASWAVLPTVVLSIVSFAHPVYASRYVTASAPGVALLAAFLSVRAFPSALGRVRASNRSPRSLRNRTMVVTGLIAAAILTVGYFDAAASLQEDLRGPVLYAARHAERGDVIALPDHAITAASEYYLSSEKRALPLWPQSGLQQRFVEGLDLKPRPSTSGHPPRRVWLLTDNSVPGVRGFQDNLERDGYLLWEVKQFKGASLWLYIFGRPTTSVLPPSSGSSVRGTNVALTAFANSAKFADFKDSNIQTELSIKKVQFVLTGGSYSKAVIGDAHITIYPHYWLLLWNSTKVPNGTYRLQSRAANGAGKSSYSPPIRITVDN